MIKKTYIAVLFFSSLFFHHCFAISDSSGGEAPTLLDRKPYAYYTYTNRKLNNDGCFSDTPDDASHEEHSLNTIYLVKVTAEFKYLSFANENITKCEILATRRNNMWETEKKNEAAYLDYENEVKTRKDILFFIPGSLRNFKNHVQQSALLISGIIDKLMVPRDSLLLITYSWPSTQPSDDDYFGADKSKSYNSAIRSTSQASELLDILHHINDINNKVNTHMFAISRGCSYFNTMARKGMRLPKVFTSLFLMAPDVPYRSYSKKGGQHNFYDNEGNHKHVAQLALDLRLLSENTRIYYHTGDTALSVSGYAPRLFFNAGSDYKLGLKGLNDYDGRVSDSITSQHSELFISLDQENKDIRDILNSFDVSDSQKGHAYALWSPLVHEDMAKSMLINSPTLVKELAPKIEIKNNLYHYVPFNISAPKPHGLIYITPASPNRSEKWITSYENRSRRGAKVGFGKHRKPHKLHMGTAFVFHSETTKNIDIASQFNVKVASGHYKYSESNLSGNLFPSMTHSEQGDLYLYIGEEDFKKNIQLASMYLEKIQTASAPPKKHTMLVYSPLSSYAIGADGFYYMTNMAKSCQLQTAGILDDIRKILERSPNRKLSIIAPGYAGFFLYQGLLELFKKVEPNHFINNVLLASSNLPASCLEESPGSESNFMNLSILLNNYMMPNGHILVSHGTEWEHLDMRLTSTFQCVQRYKVTQWLGGEWYCSDFYNQPVGSVDYSQYPMGLYFKPNESFDDRVHSFSSDENDNDEDDTFRHYRALRDTNLISTFAGVCDVDSSGVFKCGR